MYTFIDAPEITQHLVAQNLELSSTATLSCGYTAQPAPSAITWIKDATVLSATNRLTIDSSSTSSKLQIQDLSEEDSGIYQCLVENALGDVLSSAMIEVTGTMCSTIYFSNKVFKLITVSLNRYSYLFYRYPMYFY